MTMSTTTTMSTATTAITASAVAITARAEPLLLISADWQIWLQDNMARDVSDDKLMASMVKGNIAEELARSCIASVRHTTALNKQLGIKPLAPLQGDWQTWLDTQIAAGGIERTLIEAATLSIRSKFAKHMKQVREQSESKSYTYEPPLFPLSGALQADGRTMPILMSMNKPRIVLFGNVLSKDECEQIIALAQPKMAPSQTRNSATAELVVTKQRTSHGTFLKLGETPLIQRLEARIAALTQWPVAKGEGLQVLHYLKEGEFQPHYDFFAPEQPSSQFSLKSGGQRVATLIVYLNTVDDGGETIFPKLNLKVKAIQGNALYFSYTNSKNELDRNTFHGGAPVLQGDKWIMTKWMRQENLV
jgi:prolyl 4-hydroxylase